MIKMRGKHNDRENLVTNKVKMKKKLHFLFLSKCSSAVTKENISYK
jgi:hypothetical protein